MAIIFISTKKRQRVFFWGISLVFFFVATALSFAILLPELERNTTPAPATINIPDIKINFEVIDSVQVKNLEPFKETPANTQYPLEENISAGRNNPFTSN